MPAWLSVMVMNMTLMTEGHRGGGILDELVHWFIRGLAWRAGGRIANAMPMGLLIIVIVVIGGIWWYKNRQNKN